MTRPNDKLKTKTLRSSVQNFVTRTADRNNVKPMLLSVPFMVVVLPPRLSTTRASEGFCWWKFFCHNRMAYGIACFISFWIFEACLFCGSIYFISIICSPVPLPFWIGLSPSFQAGMKLVKVGFSPLFLTRKDLFFICLYINLFDLLNSVRMILSKPFIFLRDLLGVGSFPQRVDNVFALLAFRSIAVFPSLVSVKLLKRLWYLALRTSFLYRIKHGDSPWLKNSPCYNLDSLCCGFVTAMVRAGSVFAHAFGSISFPEIISQNRCSIKISAGIS